MKILEQQIIPHPYTYLPAKAIKESTDNGIKIRWFDLADGRELPPYFGYGSDAQEKVNNWYKNKNVD